MDMTRIYENHKVRGLQAVLDAAGVHLDGSRPWDLRVHDSRLFGRLRRQGSLGLGEAYMDEWWDCEQLDECVARLLRAGADRWLTGSLLGRWYEWRAQLLNLQSRCRAWIVGERHYDLGYELFARMLDRRMTYTCGYWQDAVNLEEAQERKLELVCRKLGLKAGYRVLDIGCGWGSFAEYAASRYGAQVVGVTISRDQARYAAERCRELPVDIRLQDYRDVDGCFDHLVSLGMFEHVGVKNYRIYMATAHRLLRDDGLFLLHTIGSNTSVHTTDPWIGQYIFPNGMLPSIAQIGLAIETRFVMEDWHNFGADYDKTLMAWYSNFERHWPELAGHYDQRFFRMWRYYLLTCAGSFRARKSQLWQIVLSKHGCAGGYGRLR